MARKKKKIFDNKDKSYWIYDSNYITDKWQYCYAHREIVMAWDIIGDYRNYADQNSIGSKLREFNNQPEERFQKESLAIWNFLSNMKKGDIVYVKKGINTIVARGVVTGDYDFIDCKGEIYKNRRKVEWDTVGEWRVKLPEYDCVLWSLNGCQDVLSDINKKIDAFVSKESKRYWLVVLDSEAIPVMDTDGRKKVELPFYTGEINIGDDVVIYDWPKRNIWGSINISEKDRHKQAIYGSGNSCILGIEEWSDEDILSPEIISFLQNPDANIIQLKSDEFDLIINSCNLRESDDICPPYTMDDFLKEVFMTEEQLGKLIKLIKRKKNVILQGPPGVGKTFSAKRLAYVIMGEQNESRVECIQFHQNYSYEDFIMGYKPSETGKFDLQNGIFYKFCKKAAKDAYHSYFFIIDEINRGNLSKIFGELFQLIESDYRDKEIKLAYRDEAFSVPSNLYIVGMMNTADRSLALIDYALRRRFSFFEMKPGFDTNGFRNYTKEKKSKILHRLIDAVNVINDIILDDDSLGKGFLIGHSYLMQEYVNFDKDLAESIIECDLIPLVQEYWFDNESKVRAAEEILRKVLKDDE